MNAWSQFNPLKHPAWVAWEKTAFRLADTALRDPYFLRASGQGLKAMLNVIKLQEQGWALLTGGAAHPAAAEQVGALKARLADLEARVAQHEARRAGGTREKT